MLTMGMPIGREGKDIAAGIRSHDEAGTELFEPRTVLDIQNVIRIHANAAFADVETRITFGIS